MRLIGLDVEALALLRLIFAAADDYRYGTFDHVTDLLTLVRVVGICLSAWFDRYHDGFHLVLLCVRDKPASLVLELVINLDGIIFRAVDDLLLLLLTEEIRQIRS